MKKQILTTLLLVFALTMTAQDKNHNEHRRQFSPEHFRKELETFVTREAKLTESEAAKFYPLLHEMMAKQRHNNNEARKLMQSCNDNTTDADYAKVIDKCCSLDIENKTIEKEYYKKFNTVLSWKKIHSVRIALFKFNMHALKRFSPPREGERPRPLHNN